MAGDHDHGHIRQHVLQRPKNLHAGHVGQLNVQKCEVKPALLDLGQGLAPCHGRLGLVAFLGEYELKAFTRALIVIHDQDALRVSGHSLLALQSGRRFYLRSSLILLQAP